MKARQFPKDPGEELLYLGLPSTRVCERNQKVMKIHHLKKSYLHNESCNCFLYPEWGRPIQLGKAFKAIRRHYFLQVVHTDINTAEKVCKSSRPAAEQLAQRRALQRLPSWLLLLKNKSCAEREEQLCAAVEGLLIKHTAAFNDPQIWHFNVWQGCSALILQYQGHMKNRFRWLSLSI